MTNEIELAALLEEAIEGRLSEVCTAMPGTVENYDATKQVADVRPVFKRKYLDGHIEPLPLITEVPVVFPRAAGASISFPLAPGDRVWLQFSQRSVDLWKQAGGKSVDPDDPRKFHISDAVCYPGCYPLTEPDAAASSTDLVILCGNAKINVQPGGKFTIKNKSTGKELFAILDSILTHLIAAQVVTAIGPKPFMPNTILALTQDQIDLESLKGS